MAITLQQRVTEQMTKLRPDWAPDKLAMATQYLMRCGIEQQGWKGAIALANLERLLDDAINRPAGPSGTYVNTCLNVFSPQYDQRKQTNILADQAAALSWTKGPYAAEVVAKAQAAQAPVDAARTLFANLVPGKEQDILEALVAVLSAATGGTDTQALSALNDLAFGVRGAVCRDKLVAAIGKLYR